MLAFVGCNAAHFEGRLMAYETKDMTGSLFKNMRKEKETHPDYNGSCRINGRDLWISAWLTAMFLQSPPDGVAGGMTN